MPTLFKSQLYCNKSYVSVISLSFSKYIVLYLPFSCWYEMIKLLHDERKGVNDISMVM